MIYFVLKKRGKTLNNVKKKKKHKINSEAEGWVWRSDLGIPPSPDEEETFHWGNT